MFKENLREETFDSDKEYAKTIKAIEKQSNTKPQDKNIYFQHPLKTLNVELDTIKGRGFMHVQEEKIQSIDKKIIQEMPITKTKKSNSVSIQTDAPTLKDIESHMGKIDLQK